MAKTIDFKDLALMRAGVDYSFEIRCREFKRKVRPLTNLEIMEATAAAVEAYDKQPEERKNQVTMSLLQAMHQLEKAAAPDVGEPTTLSLALLGMMTADEVNHLWKQYVEVIDRANPSLEEIPLAELERVAEELKKNSNPRSMLIDLSISKLIALCHHLSAKSNG